VREPAYSEVAETRVLLDQLLADSKLYRNSTEYMELLRFVASIPNFAPFNALLLRVQKPGLLHAGSERDWRERYGRSIKDGARPLIILWPFGPVAFVYDVADTDGPPLPDGLDPFVAHGRIDEGALIAFCKRLESKHIRMQPINSAPSLAGSISVLHRAYEKDEYSAYMLELNLNHDPNVQFATMVHELAHLYLGHLGRDPKLSVPERQCMGRHQQELEAESVSYLVCARQGVESRAHTYLAGYVQSNTSTDSLDIYQVMRAAGQVEALLGLGTRSKF
jgi:hypothetical protein